MVVRFLVRSRVRPAAAPERTWMAASRSGPEAGAAAWAGAAWAGAAAGGGGGALGGSGGGGAGRGVGGLGTSMGGGGAGGGGGGGGVWAPRAAGSGVVWG